MDQTGNPAFNTKIIDNLAQTGTDSMTRGGTYIKTGFLLLVTVISAIIAWRLLYSNSSTLSISWLPIFGASIATLILGIIISFNPKSAPMLSPLYAIVEGALLGIISASYASLYDGVVGQAIIATIGAFCAVYIGYSLGILRATPKFAKIIIFGMFGVLLISLGSWLFSLFTGTTPLYLSTSNWSIGLSFVIVAIASLSLVLDFDFIERASKQNMPKYFEWYGAFGLLVGLIWLYLELLRLFGKIAARQ